MTPVSYHTKNKSCEACTTAVPCSRLYGARVEAVEVPQPPLGHSEAAGIVHEDEALLEALMIDRGGDVPCGNRKNTKYENTAAAAAAAASNGKLKVK